jgi:hypothetical protein
MFKHRNDASIEASQPEIAEKLNIRRVPFSLWHAFQHVFQHAFQLALQHTFWYRWYQSGKKEDLMTTEKTRENRLRRKARRCGYELQKSRTRDPHALGFGLYALIDPQTGGTVNPWLAGGLSIHSWFLDDVEHWLTRECEA